MHLTARTLTASPLRAARAPAAIVLLLAVALLALPAAAARAISISPLNGTPAASRQTQISFLGVAARDIRRVSVVGSRSGRHRGRLAAYASATGASFLVGRPFTEGEEVTASALVRSPRHDRRVSTTFTVARQAFYPHPPAGPSPKARPGTVQSFVSEPALHPPSVQVNVASSAPGPSDVFIAPNHGAGQWGPMIIDETGQLVWFQAVPKGLTAMNLQVQRYRGQPVLVWWQGYISRLGLGFGTNEVYSANYKPIAQVRAGNGYLADLHEVQLTPRGSAFITAYSLIRADLSSGGGSRQGTLVDSIVQEIDVKTGLVMFEWHSWGHVPVWDTYTRPTAASRPWDYFHINSVEPDPWSHEGDFVICSRNTWAAYEISYHNGAVLWRLGGKRSSFKMGPGTATAWQHDARWQPDRTLSIFDNGSAPRVHSQSRVIRERIDWRRRRVTVVDRDVHKPALLSNSQGNAEGLDDGGVFVGWGEQPYMTRFSPTGRILFDARLPGPGQSYRAYRQPWSATPATAPAVAVRSSGPGTVVVYASWNGSTEVRSWRVHAGSSPDTLGAVLTVPRAGFETAIPFSSGERWFAVQALGSSGEVLATSSAAHA